MFATGPRAVGFTIVWPEGVIFRSMMTYHVQFLLLVLAGWVNRQQQDVIDYLQEENRVLRAGLRGKRLRLSDDERRRLAVQGPGFGPRGAGPDCVGCHTRYASALVPLPHRQPTTMAARTGAQADLRRRRTSVSSLCAWRRRTRLLVFILNREDFSFVIHLDRQPRTSRRREAQTRSRARSGSRSEGTLDAVEHSRTLMEWWPFLIFHRGGLRIKVINKHRRGDIRACEAHSRT